MRNFLEMYKTLNVGNLDRLRDVYRDDIHFVDPAHEIKGISDLTRYFESLYSNIQSISFSFGEPLIMENKGYVRWKMQFVHPRLAGGNNVDVEGATYLEMDNEGRVYYHRDYFDLGAMVYENVPMLGGIIKTLKKRLGQ